MRSPGARLPRLACRLMEWAATRLEIPELAEDAAEIFEEAHRCGAWAARRWYWRQTVAAVLRAAWLGPGARRPHGSGARGSAHVAARKARGTFSLDVKLAGRLLFRQPGLTLVAMLALAIGIPVGLLPVHVLRALSTRPPVDQAEEIVLVRNHDRVTSRPVLRPLHDFVRWREQLESFEGLGIWRTDVYTVSADGERGAPVRGAEMTASVFALLGVQPMLGRRLDEADERIGAPAVVVIGYDLWQSRLAGDPDVIGRTIRVGSLPHMVVGVMPQEFLFPVRDRLWLPFRHDPLTTEQGAGPTGYVIGRLSDGVTIEEARSEIEILGQRLATELPATHAQLRPQVLPYTVALTEIDSPEARVGIVIFQVLAFLLLALACGNVGILMLARAATRTREIAIRTALGAGRARIVSQLFIESLVIAVLAAGAGLLVLQAVVRGPDYLLAGLPYWVDFDVTPATVGIALLLAAGSATIAGVLPALKATGKSVQLSIQRASGGGSGIRFGRGYSALIIGEVAASVLLLAFGSSLLPLVASAPAGLGIPTSQYLHASIRMTGEEAMGPGAEPGARPRVAAVHEELIRRLSAEPGAGPVAIGSGLPGTSHAVRYVQVEGIVREVPAPAFLVNVARVDVGFFDALDQPILRGRGFSRADLGEDRSAVIVNTAFVERVLGGRNALGRRIRYWTPDRAPGAWSHEIVGVVGSLGMNPLNAEADQGLYEAAAPGELHPVRIAIHIGANPSAFAPRLRSIVDQIDAGALIEDAMPLDAVPDAERPVLVLMTWLLGLLSGIAVLLAAACLHALLSFTVAERTHECGIRTALGARPADIAGAIVRRAFTQLAIGVLIGTALSALLLSEFDELNASFLRTTHWPLTVTGVALLMMITGVVACARPTLRLVRIRPADALRS